MANKLVRSRGTGGVVRFAVCVAATALVGQLEIASASAQSPHPPQLPSIAQYLESVPTSGGNVASGASGGRKLPSALTQTIDRLAGKEAATLKTIVGSAAYGAPQRPLVREGRNPKAKPTPTSDRISLAGISAAAGTFSGAGTNTLPLLLLAAVAIALAGACVVVRRRRI